MCGLRSFAALVFAGGYGGLVWFGYCGFVWFLFIIVDCSCIVVIFVVCSLVLVCCGVRLLMFAVFAGL